MRNKSLLKRQKGVGLIEVLVSMVVLSLSLEVATGKSEDIYSREPKLRDAFLQVLFDHANTGGFSGSFTDGSNLIVLRTSLKEAAALVLGSSVNDVLITVGIIVALSHSEYPVTAEVVQDGRLIAWGQQTIQELMLQHPRLAVNGLRMLANYFVGLQKQLQELTTERVERRVARALLRLVRQTGRKVEEGILIDVPLSRQDLAEMTGTTLFTVSRILKGWEQNGIVLPERERVTVCLPHQLVLIAEDLPQGGGA